MSTNTYAAYGGEREYTITAADGTTFRGQNPPDSSHVGFISRANDPQKIVQYIKDNRLTAVGVVRAFNERGYDGVSIVLNAVAESSVIAEWYATQEPLVVKPFVIQPPAPAIDLVAEGQALILAVQAYVEKVRGAQA